MNTAIYYGLEVIPKGNIPRKLEGRNMDLEVRPQSLSITIYVQCTSSVNMPITSAEQRRILKTSETQIYIMDTIKERLQNPNYRGPSGTLDIVAGARPTINTYSWMYDKSIMAVSLYANNMTIEDLIYYLNNNYVEVV